MTLRAWLGLVHFRTNSLPLKSGLLVCVCLWKINPGLSEWGCSTWYSVCVCRLSFTCVLCTVRSVCLSVCLSVWVRRAPSAQWNTLSHCERCLLQLSHQRLAYCGQAVCEEESPSFKSFIPFLLFIFYLTLFFCYFFHWILKQTEDTQTGN